MPPMFTSSSWTTFVKKAVHSARHSLSSKAVNNTNHFGQSIRNLSRLAKAKVTLRRALHQTYPSLRTQAYTTTQMGHMMSHGTMASSRFISALPHRGTGHFVRGAQRVARSNLGFARSPSYGPKGVSQVGLGASRNFSTAFQAVPQHATHLPLFIRALVNELDLDDLKEKEKNRVVRVKASKYDSYPPRSRRFQRVMKRQQRNTRLISPTSPRIDSSSSCADTGINFCDSSAEVNMLDSWIWAEDINRVDSSLRIQLSDLDRLFPQPHTPLVTRGWLTTLTLRLTPDEPAPESEDTTPDEAASEIEDTTSETPHRLYWGVPELLGRIAAQHQTRVQPVIDRLSSCRLDDINLPADLRMVMKGVGSQAQGAIYSVLVFEFPNRCILDLYTCLGDIYADHSSEGWISLDECPLPMDFFAETTYGSTGSGFRGDDEATRRVDKRISKKHHPRPSLGSDTFSSPSSQGQGSVRSNGDLIIPQIDSQVITADNAGWAFDHAAGSTITQSDIASNGWIFPLISPSNTLPQIPEGDYFPTGPAPPHPTSNGYIAPTADTGTVLYSTHGSLAISDSGTSTPSSVLSSVASLDMELDGSTASLASSTSSGIFAGSLDSIDDESVASSSGSFWGQLPTVQEIKDNYAMYLAEREERERMEAEVERILSEDGSDMGFSGYDDVNESQGDVGEEELDQAFQPW